MDDYAARKYLSVNEVAGYTQMSVRHIHRLVKDGRLPAFKSTGGQYRFKLADIVNYRSDAAAKSKTHKIKIGGTLQKVHCGDARKMRVLANNSVNLAVTSPPYFNAKMYAPELAGDLGNVHDFHLWLEEMEKVWAEVFRVLQAGRKFFLNIMNLPVREKGGGFRTLNLVGRTIDSCEKVGFAFKRDIVWHKTNGVRAHFGTYPYPGGILINNMHEFILEFQKPGPSSGKYDHLTDAQKERSKLDKEFWLSLKNSDVWLMKPEKSGGNRSHAAPFPLELPARLIRAFSYVGEMVLDPFAGSGTSLMAAAAFGRNGVGYDINPEFCDMAAARLRNYDGPLFAAEKRGKK